MKTALQPCERWCMMYGNARTGNPCVASKSERDNPAVAGFRQSCRNRAYSRPACGQPKPKSLHSRVFSFLATTPQGGLADGPVWAAPKKHRLPAHPRLTEPAFLSGTGQVRGTTVEPDLFRLNDDLKGLWMIAKHDSGAGRMFYPPLVDLWPKEKKNA